MKFGFDPFVKQRNLNPNKQKLLKIIHNKSIKTNTQKLLKNRNYDVILLTLLKT